MPTIAATAATDTADPLVEPRAAGLTRAGAARLDAIDMLRGLMIVLMVLDHVRDFFGTSALGDPTNPATSWPTLFATRWITHLCAPTFVLLAGTSIFLQSRAKPAAALSRFLLARGAWLILLELTVVGFGFNFGEPFIFLQVIWAIGFGMVAMSLLARLGPAVLLALGLALIAFCPMLVPLTQGASGGAAIVRTLLLAPGVLPGIPSLAMYPALPWLGIMCLGFGLGPLFAADRARWTRTLLIVAPLLLASFVLLRWHNGYGDPAPWTTFGDPARTAMSFLNVSKYPPSPDYVLSTLGVSFLLFLALDRLRGPVARVLLDFGRTPLFTYVAHIYIAHGAMLLLAAATGAPNVAFNLISGQLLGQSAASSWGYGLPGVYLAWAGVVAALVPLSRWFADVKRRRRDPWLSFL